MKRLLALLLGLTLMSCGNTKNTTKTSTTITKAENHDLPASVFGEWLDPSGDNEYNGLLIHPNFIEYSYTAFMYNKITNQGDQIYKFTGKDNSGQIVSFQLQVLNENTITLQRGHYPKTTFIKQKYPLAAQPVSMADVPKDIKSQWYSTNGENTLEFDLTNHQFKFKGDAYKVDEIMHFVEPDLDQYRFVVSDGNKSWLFYFKHWNKNHVQIGYNKEKGAIYKSNKSFSESSNTLPETVFGEWYDPSGHREYNGVLLQPNFIEYNYTAFMFESIQKISDTDYQFTAKNNLNRTITGTISLLNKTTISIQRAFYPVTTYIKQKLPLDATPVSLAEVPAQIKGAWALEKAQNLSNFIISDTQFIFRDREYEVDEVTYINDSQIEQYRFVVSAGEQTYMFYFKNWSKNRIRIGFNGRKGNFYQKD